jgi:hypothetical protein
MYKQGNELGEENNSWVQNRQTDKRQNLFPCCFFLSANIQLLYTEIPPPIVDCIRKSLRWIRPYDRAEISSIISTQLFYLSQKAIKRHLGLLEHACILYKGNSQH